jgi:hypothetical protein
MQRSTDFPALHGQPIQTPAFRVCYLDDLNIASHTLEEHQEYLRQIFTILQENGLQINPAKCVFAAATVEFLGHRVDQHGVWPLQRHVQAISDFPPPQDVKQLQQFLGMVNFYSVSFQVSPAHYSRSQMHSEGPPRRWSGCPLLPSEQPRPPWRLWYHWRTPPRTRRRHASTGELAAAGILLQEAVGGGHQVLHLRQGPAGRLQISDSCWRGDSFASSLTTSHCHIPVPHHAMVSPPTATALLHRRIHIRHQTHTRPRERGGRRLERPTSSSRAATAASPAALSRPHRRGLARGRPGGTRAAHFGCHR